jgi:hypothetical protein
LAAQAAMRKGTEQSSYIPYTNASRHVPIEERYKGSGSVEKLKGLKKNLGSDRCFYKRVAINLVETHQVGILY